MAEYKEMYQSADWKKEKHVPVIESSEKINKGDIVSVKISVGKEIPHPNTTEHHIRWIEAYYLPEGEKYPLQLARVEFTSHGESAQGPNAGPVFSQPAAEIKFKTDKPGTLFAASYCNIHGLWQSSKSISF